MKLDLAMRDAPWSADAATLPPRTAPAPVRGVDSEYGRLTRVMVSAPTHLSMVPCNSVTREALRNGLDISTARAGAQHAALVRALADAGAEPLSIPPSPDLPDQSFMRDTTLMTPWGLVGLRPGAFHRRGEVDHVLAAAEALGVPMLGRIERGTIEGGDICILRPGLVIIGVTGSRTNDEGAEALAAIFRKRGWRAMLHHFDPHFLHLDTIFTVVDAHLALGCRDVLDDDFMAEMESSGIEILPVSYKQARRLGCNVVSLGERRVLTSVDNEAVNAQLDDRGYDLIPLDISQFTRCGGGIHCLTMPLSRMPG